MKIQTDKDGMSAVRELCNVALRAGGLQNHQFVAEVLLSLRELKEPPKDPEEKSKD